jgi:hypothetical protein
VPSNSGDFYDRVRAVIRDRPTTSMVAAGAALVVLFGITNFAVRPPAAIATPADTATEPASADAAVTGGPATVAADTFAPDAAAGSTPGDATEAAARAAVPPPVPVPAAERVPKPARVRGLYLNAWAAGSSRKLARLIDVANRTEINTFVIDVKEGGEVSYRSSVPLVAAIGSDRAYIPNIRTVLAKMRENGIYPIARIVVFKDEVAASARPEWAVVKADGSIWNDHYGDTWVDSYNREVWDYNIAIAREAVELGFSEVQWDYVRFPDVPRSYMRTAVWPAAAERSKADAIREFLQYSRAQLADLGVPVTADVFGLTVSAHDDMGIGQQWDKMVDATDVLLPMVYPSHFAKGSYGIANPNASPYEIIETSMGHALRRTSGVPGAATIRPWLQDFTLGPPRYGPYHVRAQIDAAHEAGVHEWVLWNPGSNYTVEALAAEGGPPPDFASPVPALPAVGDSTRDRTGDDRRDGRARGGARRDTLDVDTLRRDTMTDLRDRRRRGRRSNRIRQDTTATS